MEFEPQSENGKRLFAALSNLMENSPQPVMDDLKRMFLMCSLKLKNEDTFITLLYAHKVLNKSPSLLSLRFPSTLLRVQHAMEISLKKRRTKELVVALELSKNQAVLMDVLSWTKERFTKNQVLSTPLEAANEVVIVAERPPPEFPAVILREHAKSAPFESTLGDGPRVSLQSLPQKLPEACVEKRAAFNLASTAPPVVPPEADIREIPIAEAPQGLMDELPLPSRYNCDVDGCDFQCRSKKLLDDHQKFKHDGTCPHCLKTLRISTLRWAHDCLNPKRPRVTDPSLVCSHCSKQFEAPGALWDHLNGISLPCKKCGKKARRRDNHKC